MKTLATLFKFPVHDRIIERLGNYDLFMMPNGIYRAREVVADNFLYPMYTYHDGESYVVSTSVYALIHHKGEFVRNPRFQTTHFYRPTFMTIDEKIMRVRTTHRRSTLELTDPEAIIRLGVELIQDYISEIEVRYPGWVHVLQMGGKDSQNIILCQRKERWVVLSGEPNAPLNRTFIEDNGIAIERFVSTSNETDDSMLLEEIMGSDCSFDVAHIRYMPLLRDLVREFNGKVVLWMGTSGDGVFSRNNNHRDKDYYAVHDLHVGTSMGVLHQVYKNVLNIPVVSPYQSPRMLDELFYRFDPYFVDTAGDIRKRMGEMLLGRPVKYPESNPTPAAWRRDRRKAIPMYVRQLKREDVPCTEHTLRSWITYRIEAIGEYINLHSTKRRSRLSKVLFPLRRSLSKWIPAIRNKRHDIATSEIR